MKNEAVDVGLHEFYEKYFLFKEKGIKKFYSDFRGLALLIDDVQFSNDYNISKMKLSDRVAFTLAMSIIGNNVCSRYNIVHSFRVGKIMYHYANHINYFYGREVLKPSIAKAGGFYHDIGHIMSPEEILLREGDVSDQEKIILEKHTINGERILRILGVQNSMILDCAKFHHEKYNGKGYYGLFEDVIPFISRMVNVVDVYDAIRGKRSYKNPIPKRIAASRMYKDFFKEKCFDPELFFIFMNNLDDFEYLYDFSELYESIIMVPN